MKSRYIILALIVILVIIGIISEYASALPGYNYYTKYEFTNTGTQTYEAPINFEINAVGMIDGYYIKPDASDIAVTYLGQEEYVTAMNLNSGSAIWRYEYTTIPSDGQTIKVLWYGNNTAMRNQPWIAANGDICTLPTNPGSFNFAAYAGGSGTQPFAIQLNIEPVTYPGTKQLIIGLGDSWKLELYPQTDTSDEPWYKWSVKSGSGNVVHSATITANVGQMDNLWCWYNGTDIVISDGSHYKSTALPVGLVSDTGTPVLGAVDAVIDKLRITTPGSITAPAGGAPPLPDNIYMIGPDDTTLLPEPCYYCTTGIPVYGCSGESSTDSDGPLYMINGIINEFGDNSRGWTWFTESESYYDNRAYYSPGTWPGNQTDTITGVSVRIAGYIRCTTGGNSTGIQPVICDNNSSWYEYGWQYVEPTTGNYQYDVLSGTRTLAPNGQPWTINELLNGSFGVVFDSNPYYVSGYDITELYLYVSVDN